MSFFCFKNKHGDTTELISDQIVWPTEFEIKNITSSGNYGISV